MKRLQYITSMLLIGLLTTVLSACKNDEVEPIPLGKPNITLKEATASSLVFEWTPVENAAQYAYRLIDAQNTTVKSGVTTYTSATFTGLTASTEYILEVTAVAHKANKLHLDGTPATSRGRTAEKPVEPEEEGEEDDEGNGGEDEAPHTLSGGNGIGKMSYFTCPSKGKIRFPVIIVEYKDIKLSDTDENVMLHFDQFFNQQGYDHDGATGSVRDYFRYASAGQFDPQFDILGVVRLKHDREYYGEGAGTAYDLSEEMVIEAVEQQKDKVDFSVYDSDKDGYVDDVIVVYAGNAERFDAPESAVMPTSFLISLKKWGQTEFAQGYTIGDMKVNSYTVTSETAYGKYDGIGTFVHEFSHGLGLADLYNLYDTNSNYTPMDYDVMDVGLYNNNSHTPPTYSAFERFALGWIDLEVIDKPGDLELEPLGTSNKAYIIPVTDNEFFILENRQQQDWDKYLPGHGLLIWHIDYNHDLWYANTVNKEKTHQCVDLIEACGSPSSLASKWQGYPFPGAKNVTSYTLDQTWQGKNLKLAITNITESNGKISARVETR